MSDLMDDMEDLEELDEHNSTESEGTKEQEKPVDQNDLTEEGPNKSADSRERRVFGKVEVLLKPQGEIVGRKRGRDDGGDTREVHEESGKRFRPSIQLSAAPVSHIPLGDLKGPSQTDGAIRWDFSGALCAERSSLSPPCPSTELFRCEQIKLLRSLLNSSTQSNLFVSPQPETMNRWLLAQVASSTPTTTDPILRHPEIALETDVLKTQLMLMVPGSAYIPWNRRSSPPYIISVAEKWCYSLVSLWCGPVKEGGVIVPDENADALKELVEEARGTWLKRGSLAPAGRLIKLFHGLIDKCKPLLLKKCAGAVAEVGKLLVNRAVRSAKRIADYDMASYEDELKEVKVIEHPLDDVFEVQFRSDSLRVTTMHAKKLRRLYEMNRNQSESEGAVVEGENGGEEPKINERVEKEFNAALYVLLRRYQTLFGKPNEGGKREGAMFHAAAPETLFRLLGEKMDVLHECFASPFNCYFRSYCSAFPDTDGVFGSSGEWVSGWVGG